MINSPQGHAPKQQQQPAAESRPDGLTACQQQAWDLLAPIFQGQRPDVRASLTGYAGAGKTFLQARLIALAVERFATRISEPPAPGSGWTPPGTERLPELLLLAPTHKACRQIEKALAEHGIDGIEARTLHSALGLRVKRQEDRETFHPSLKARKLVGRGTRLVVVDEASMVGVELTQLLLQSLPGGAALVAIGDPAQLQPVGEDQPSQLLSFPEHAHLDEVVRYGGPILQLATETRELGTGRPKYREARDGQSVITAHPSFEAWSQAALASCHTAALEQDFDAARMLAWTNRAVDNFNDELHRLIYGPEAPRFVAGQPIVSRDTVPSPDGIGLPLVHSTCEMVVISAERDAGPIDGDGLSVVRDAVIGTEAPKTQPMPFWRWWVIEADIFQGAGARVKFRVLRREYRDAWRRADRAICIEAKRAESAGEIKAARGLWNLYWRRRDAFGEVNPIWGLTIHKSQGSTFRRVFLHPEIDRNLRPVDLNRMAYVGMTRPQRELHVLADWGQC